MIDRLAGEHLNQRATGLMIGKSLEQQADSEIMELLKEERQLLKKALFDIMNELGVPSGAYPENIANAYKIAHKAYYNEDL